MKAPTKFTRFYIKVLTLIHASVVTFKEREPKIKIELLLPFNTAMTLYLHRKILKIQTTKQYKIANAKNN